MECSSSECSCGHGASRREVLTTAMAAAVAIPLLSRAAGAQGAPPASAPAADAWVPTVKAADLKDNVATPVTGHTNVVVTRTGTSVMAVGTKCTHKGCSVKPSAAAVASMTCPCHGAEFDLTGKNLQGPHKPPATAPASLKPLTRFALRLNSDGIVEVNPAKPSTPTPRKLC